MRVSIDKIPKINTSRYAEGMTEQQSTPKRKQTHTQ